MLFALMLLTINFICYQTLGLSGIKNVMRVIAIFFSIISAWVGGFENITLNKTDFISLFVGAVTFVLSGYSTLNFMVILIFIICLKRYSMSEFIHMCAISNVASLIIYLAGCILGRVQWIQYISFDRARNTLGFTNVNAASIYFLALIVIWIIDKSNKFRWIIGSLVIIWIYRVTDTRTLIIGYIIFAGLSLLFGKVKNKISIIYRLMNYFLAFLVVTFAVLTFRVNEVIKRFPNLDKLLSNRLSIVQNSLNMLSTKQILFGGGNMEIDNSYFNILSMGGILLLILVVILVVYAFVRNTDYESVDFKVASIVFCVVAVGIMESLWFRPEILICLIFWKFIYDNAGKQITYKKKDSSCSHFH